MAAGPGLLQFLHQQRLEVLGLGPQRLEPLGELGVVLVAVDDDVEFGVVRQPAERQVGGADDGDALLVPPVVPVVEDVGLGVQAALGVDLHLQPLLLDHPHQGPDQGLGVIRLVHPLDRVPEVGRGLLGTAASARSLEVSLPLLGRRHQFEALVALGDLLDRLPVRRVADQQAQAGDPVQVLRHRLQAGEEEIPHRELGRIRTAQDLVDVIHQLLVAVVDDVVGWHIYRPPSTILISSGVNP